MEYNLPDNERTWEAPARPPVPQAVLSFEPQLINLTEHSSFAFTLNRVQFCLLHGSARIYGNQAFAGFPTVTLRWLSHGDTAIRSAASLQRQ